MEIPKSVQEAVKRLIDTHGANKAAKMLGVSRGTVTSVGAGAEVQKGTLMMVQVELARIGRGAK